MNIVFITGATGNVGSRLIPELLAEKDTQLVLLIRGESETAIQQRVQLVLKFWDVPTSLAEGRIKAMRGDITEKMLGLNSADREYLEKHTTHIIHCASNLKFNMSIEEARKEILEPTYDLVKIARACQKQGNFKSFSYISTLEIIGDYNGILYEEFTEGYKRRFVNTYEQGKYEAESFLKKEIESGLPVIIYRPSFIVGDSENGKILSFQSFYYIIKDLLLSPLYPVLPGNNNFEVDAIPLDILAKAIVATYNDEKCVGEIYHLASGTKDSLPLLKFLKEANSAYYKLTGQIKKLPAFVHPNFFYILLKVIRLFLAGKAKKRINTQLIFMEFLTLKPQFDNARFAQKMKEKGIDVPVLKNYLPALLKYYLQEKSKK